MCISDNGISVKCKNYDCDKWCNCNRKKMVTTGVTLTSRYVTITINSYEYDSEKKWSLKCIIGVTGVCSNCKK